MEPTIAEREDQPSVALRAKVAMTEIGAFADRTPELFSRFAARGIDPGPIDTPDLNEWETELLFRLRG
ncbi:hypothetical protein GCM10009789_01450 [Kribbella sancticallisti]|uniref:Uncharacterized protein n=1 Tax=Kribbella sancticallisti TaxID=460087 RepID=A0ABP4MWB9_9ACTN